MKFILRTLIIAVSVMFYSSAYAIEVKKSDVDKVTSLRKKADAINMEIAQTGRSVIKDTVDNPQGSQRFQHMFVCFEGLHELSSRYTNQLQGLWIALSTAKLMKDDYDKATVLNLGADMYFSLIKENMPDDRNFMSNTENNCQDSALIMVKAQKLLDLMNEIDTILPPIAKRLGLQKESQ